MRLGELERVLALLSGLGGDQVITDRHPVAGALAEGASWQDIGDALGIHPDTAFRRFSDLKIGRTAPE